LSRTLPGKNIDLLKQASRELAAHLEVAAHEEWRRRSFGRAPESQAASGKTAETTEGTEQPATGTPKTSEERKSRGAPVKWPDSIGLAIKLLDEGESPEDVYLRCKKEVLHESEKLPGCKSFIRAVLRHRSARR